MKSKTRYQLESILIHSRTMKIDSALTCELRETKLRHWKPFDGSTLRVFYWIRKSQRPQ